MNQIDDIESEVISDGEESTSVPSDASQGSEGRQEEVESRTLDESPAPEIELAPGQEPPFPTGFEPGLRWVLHCQVELRRSTRELIPDSEVMREFDRLILGDIRDTLMAIVKPRNKLVRPSKADKAAAPPVPAPTAGSQIEVNPEQEQTILRIRKMKDLATMKAIKERQAAAKAARHAH